MRIQKRQNKSIKISNKRGSITTNHKAIKKHIVRYKKTKVLREAYSRIPSQKREKSNLHTLIFRKSNKG